MRATFDFRKSAGIVSVVSGSMGARIRAAREASGLLAAELAERVGLSASAYSLIENDKRNVKANEATAIARALGISVLSLLEDGASTGLAAAARSVSSMRAADSALLSRLNQIQDLRLALPASTREQRTVWEDVPVVDDMTELAGARALADWVRGLIDDHETGAGVLWIRGRARRAFRIDVIVESFPDDVIGAALLNRTYPTIVVNSTQQRQRSLFTLAHELGHLLAGEDGGIKVDGKISSSSPEERRANMFAAEFLLHREDVAQIVKASQNQIAPALARMTDQTGWVLSVLCVSPAQPRLHQRDRP
ncbi:helix-turn-helix domain-containing protein [Vibrio alginolyticus]